MPLDFEIYGKSSISGSKVRYGQELDALLVGYFVDPQERLSNKSAYTYPTGYVDAEWKEEARRITASPVSNFGIKTFPQFGAYGYFTPKYGDGTSKIISPINKKRSISAQPYLEIDQVGAEVQVRIRQPAYSEYDCFRVMFRDDWFATEFVTYDLDFSVDSLPPAEYTVTAIGHSDDGAISVESRMLLVELTNPSTVPETQLHTAVFSPDSKFVALGCNAAPSAYRGGLFIYSVNSVNNTLTKLTDPSGDPIPTVKTLGWNEQSNQITATLEDDSKMNFNVSTSSYSKTTTQYNHAQTKGSAIAESPDGRYVIYGTEEFKWFATDMGMKFIVA